MRKEKVTAQILVMGLLEIHRNYVDHADAAVEVMAMLPTAKHVADILTRLEEDQETAEDRAKMGHYIVALCTELWFIGTNIDALRQQSEDATSKLTEAISAALGLKPEVQVNDKRGLDNAN